MRLGRGEEGDETQDQQRREFPQAWWEARNCGGSECCDTCGHHSADSSKFESVEVGCTWTYSRATRLPLTTGQRAPPSADLLGGLGLVLPAVTGILPTLT